MPHDCSVELSPLGYQFLTVLFENHDKVNYSFAAITALTDAMVRTKMARSTRRSLKSSSAHHRVTRGLARNSRIRRSQMTLARSHYKDG